MYPNSITNVPSPSASLRLLEGGRRNDQDARGRRVTAGGTARAPDELETREAEPRTTADTFIPHVSLINLACILHVSCMYVSSNLCRYMYPAWIPHGPRMYLACIPHVSFMYLTCVPPCRCAYLARATEARKDDEEGEDSCRASRPAH